MKKIKDAKIRLILSSIIFIIISVYIFVNGLCSTTLAMLGGTVLLWLSYLNVYKLFKLEINK